MLNTDIRRTGRTGSLDRLDMFLLHSSERKKLTGARLSSEAEGSSQIGRGQHLAHSSGKALRIFRREQHAGHPQVLLGMAAAPQPADRDVAESRQRRDPSSE